MKTRTTGSCFSICIGLLFSSPLNGQEIGKGVGPDVTGLEVEDHSRLGVYLILGPAWDHEAMREAVEEELVRAGVEWTDLEDPRMGEVLYIYGGDMEQAAEDSVWTTFRIENNRIELWRPVRFVGSEGAEQVAPAMTFRLTGTAGGGYRRGVDEKAIACGQLIMSLRNFLSEFLKANGVSYEPPQDDPRGCANTQ
jgi:hypothetical protein